MSSTSLIEPDNIKFKKIFNNINFKGKININHIILNRNNPNKKFSNQTSQKNLIRKDIISPFKYNNLSSLSFLNKANNSMQKQKKIFIKSPFSLLKDVPLTINKINTNKNKSSSLPISDNKKNGNKVLNHLKNIEYNSINYIINNFNLSCKNMDTPEDINKKSDSLIRLNNYDFFDIRNKKIKNKMNNLKKNNILSNYENNVKNLSHYNELNYSNMNNNNNNNINNLSNDNIKIEEKISEIREKEEKIKKTQLETKSKMIYLKELEKKNKKLKSDYQDIKIKHEEYSKALERLYKFLRVLKNNGLDVSEMMDNISSGEDYDEYVDDDMEESEEETEEQKNETVLSDGSVLRNLNQLSTGLLRDHEEFAKSKLDFKLKNIPVLNFGKLMKH